MKAVTILVFVAALLIGEFVLAEDYVVPGCPIVCQFGISFTYPHLQNCNRYYRCQNGRLLEFGCRSGAIFDIRTLRCQTADEARCVLPAE